ncbi:hypothetical protein ACF0H5_021050 [Mactra antiquata]
MKSFLLLVVLIYAVNGQSILKCRLCNRATRLSECTSLVACDATIEECYMEELITEQLTVVYTGGCRAKDVCQRANGKKRADLASCSRCCALGNDCNKRLCGIPDDTLNTTQCYSCDHRSSQQSEVKNPEDCVTLTTCNSNEMCFTTGSDIAGSSTFFYGCQSKLICKILMKRAYEDWKICVANVTSPPSGITWTQHCGDGGAGKRSTNVCNSCCNYGGCNYGSCFEQTDRLFTLAQNGKFDVATLTLI